MATSTPWGMSQTVEQIAPGILWYSTASHGGYHLSASRLAAMPEPYKSWGPWAGKGWYEEDCDWCVVALAFPEFFTPEDGIAALRTFTQWIEPKLIAAAI
jgi:hypothetical protein